MAVTAATANAISSKTLTERSHQLRNRLYGAAFILIALLTYWLFAQGVDRKLVSTYGLNQGNADAAERVPDWVIPSYGTVAVLARKPLCATRSTDTRVWYFAPWLNV